MSGPQPTHAPLTTALVAIVIAAGLPLAAAAVIAVTARLISPEPLPARADISATVACEVTR